LDSAKLFLLGKVLSPALPSRSWEIGYGFSLSGPNTRGITLRPYPISQEPTPETSWGFWDSGSPRCGEISVLAVSGQLPGSRGQSEQCRNQRGVLRTILLAV